MSSKKAAKRNKKKGNKAEAKAAARAAKFVVAASNGDCSAITRHLDSGGLDIDGLVEIKDAHGRLFQGTALCQAIHHMQHAAVRRREATLRPRPATQVEQAWPTPIRLGA